jgi:hypothetical protein
VGDICTRARFAAKGRLLPLRAVPYCGESENRTILGRAALFNDLVQSVAVEPCEDPSLAVAIARARTSALRGIPNTYHARVDITMVIAI